MTDKYILDGTTVRSCDDLLTWARWYETAERRVERTTVADGIEVSTVFLGMNYQYGDGPPLLFETMIFGGPMDEDQARWSTWAAAEQGHAAMVERVRNLLARLAGETLG